MKTSLLWAGALLTIWLNGCAVLPRHIMDEALPVMPFSDLAHHQGKYSGETVILGGYVLSVENYQDHTRLQLLQAPLGTGQRPKSKDLSQGRITLLYQGYLDAEVYTKDRMVTVGGRILQPEEDSPKAYPHILIAVREIHLWAIEKEIYDPSWYDPWYYSPWGWHRPWHHHHRHHW